MFVWAGYDLQAVMSCHLSYFAAHYGNLRLCQKGMFEPKRIKFPVSILKHDRQESEVDVTSGTNTAGTTSTSGEPACAKPRVTFYESVNP